MLPLELLVKTYGYLAVFLWSVIGGETLPVMGGFFAHQGYLVFSLVVLSAFLGSVIADQILFFIGRIKGRKWLSKNKSFKLKIDKLHSYISKYESLVIFFFRFVYGFRTVTPLILGTGKVKTKKFVILNIISALVWSYIFVSLGFVLGKAAGTIVRDIRNIQFGIVITVLIVCFTIVISKKIKKNRKL